MKVAIIGYGFVGQATEYFLENWLVEKLDIVIHDPHKDRVVNDWASVDYAFICVPTNLKDGKLDTSIIDNILETLTVPQAIIRSTIGPDQCIKYANKGHVIMPEFLRERHWKEDVDDSDIPMVIGCNHCDNILDWLTKTKHAWYGNKKKVVVCSPLEASMIKMARNAALAVKVGLANDFSGICDSLDMDYSVIKKFMQEDKNLGGTHWDVPGPDNIIGFGGTCLPKDLTHASTLCYNTHNIMKVAVDANKNRRTND